MRILIKVNLSLSYNIQYQYYNQMNVKLLLISCKYITRIKIIFYIVQGRLNN